MTAKATPKKRSTTEIVIKEKRIPELISGSIWKLTEDQIVERKETLDKFRKILANAFKMYDTELKNQRKIHGEDYLKNVTFFRKPRATKETESTDLMDEFDFDSDD
jgi:hypothetical protein